MNNPSIEPHYKEIQKLLVLLEGALVWAEWNREHPNTINHNYLLWQIEVERTVKNLTTDMETTNE